MGAAARQAVARRFDIRDRVADYQALYARWRELYRPHGAGSYLTYGSRLDQPWIPNPLVRLVRTAMRSRPMTGSTAVRRRCRARSVAGRGTDADRHGALLCAAIGAAALGQSAAHGAVLIDVRIRARHADRSPLPARILVGASRIDRAVTCSRCRTTTTRTVRPRVTRADTLRHRARFPADLSLRHSRTAKASFRALVTTACLLPNALPHFRELDLALVKPQRIVRPGGTILASAGRTAAADR